MSTFAEELRDVPDHEVVGEMMLQVLEHIVNKFEEAAVPLPDRRYIAVGATAHDCEQLTVSFVQLYLGMPGAQAETPQQCDSPRSAVLQIQLVRTLPVPKGRGAAPPAETAMIENTLIKTQDAWLLMDAAADFANSYIGVLADVSVTPPQGEYQAVVLNLSAGVP